MLTDVAAPAAGDVRDDFYSRLATRSMVPLWQRLQKLVTPEPDIASLPHIWRTSEARALLIEAGSVITAEEAERRVLILENPGLAGKSSATEWLYAGLQMILPGEVARAHRHVPAALRFVLEGANAFTAVDGERYDMAPGDLVLTPSWTWHDHGHEGDGPFIWLDVLDLPATGKMGVCFSEHYEADRFPTEAPVGLGRARYGSNMKPVHDGSTAASSPLFHYPYADARAALATLAQAGAPHPADGYKLEYINPQTGRPALPTISTFLQLLPAGFRGARRRSTEGTILCVKEGAGRLIAGDGPDTSVIEFGPHDVLVIPNWMPSRIEADREVILFWATDRGPQQTLGLYREEANG